MSKNLFPILSLTVLFLAIGLVPSFEVGALSDGKAIELRIEDFLLVVLGTFLIVHTLRTRTRSMPRPPLFLSVLLWLSVLVLSTSLNIFSQRIETYRALFFLLKEIEFFCIFFFVFWYIRTYESIRFFLKLWIGIGVLHGAWILFQIISGLQITYYYSYTTFTEPEGGVPGAGLLLLIFIFGLNTFLYEYMHSNLPLWGKGALLCLILLPVIGVLTSASRISVIALVLTVFASFFLYALRNKYVMVGLGVAVVCMAVLAGYVVWSTGNRPTSDYKPSGTIERVVNVQGFLQEFSAQYKFSRVSIWKRQFEEWSRHPFSVFVGFGKSSRLGGEESHNYYLQAFSDAGIVGVFAFFLLLGSVIKISWEGFTRGGDSLSTGLSAGLLVATFGMFVLSLSAEAFQNVKPAEVYWSFAAFTMAALVGRKKIAHE